ncbi:MAG: 30S ribosome-binding factor RbfA [Spirochaetales bacterium]|nr:30S ribosome-binding factor RbfA [Spirochaetales bacterium]
MNEVRRKRVESLIRDLVSQLIVTGEVKDPRVSTFISITRVEVAKDVTTARIFVSSIESEDALKRAVTGLNSAAGFIQKTIGRGLRMRSTPRLKFYPDLSLKEGFEISRKLDELSQTHEREGDGESS